MTVDRGKAERHSTGSLRSRIYAECPRSSDCHQDYAQSGYTPIIRVYTGVSMPRQSVSPSAISLKSKLPQGKSKDSATIKSIFHFVSSGASTKGSKVSHGRVELSVNERAGRQLPSASLAASQTVRPSPLNTTRPVTLKDNPFPTNEALIGAFAASHFRSRDMASSRDERIFLRAAVSLGFNRAADLAVMHRWNCQRPLRALRAVLNGVRRKL